MQLTFVSFDFCFVVGNAFPRTCDHGFFPLLFFVVANTLKKLPALCTKPLLVTEVCETLHSRLKYQEIIGYLLKKKIETALLS